MVDITAFSKRIRRWSIASGIFFFGSAFMMVLDFTTKFPNAEKGGFAALWFFGMALGGYFYYRSLELPNKELVALAEARNGLLTLSEISTALDISPQVALRALRQLQVAGLARQSWQNFDKNLWEFPDLVRLPVMQVIALARQQQGNITLQDIVAAGHSVEVAQQTFTLLVEKGLAREDRSGVTRRFVLTESDPMDPLGDSKLPSPRPK